MYIQASRLSSIVSLEDECATARIMSWGQSNFGRPRLPRYRAPAALARASSSIPGLAKQTASIMGPHIWWWHSVRVGGVSADEIPSCSYTRERWSLTTTNITTNIVVLATANAVLAL